MHVLVLGGTAEARELAALLEREGVRVTSSLAGRVSRPRLPVGEVRIGGFGGADGLAAWTREHGVDAVIDATHPFATTMSRHAAEACATTGHPLLRLARPGWAGHPEAASWTWVDGYEAAREAADDLGGTPFVTTGRQTLHHYTRPWAQRPVLVRLVEPPVEPLPGAWTVLRSRGPFDLDAELSTMREHAVDVLLTKDSGGDFTAPKLSAAATLGVPVVVVRRPAAQAGVPEVTSAADVAALLLSGATSAGAPRPRA